MSSKPVRYSQRPRYAGYFGRTVGSPPGLPGGGITGVLPTSGVGARISGSTPVGGQSTPSDLANLSPNGSGLWPVVLPSGVIVPCDGTGRVCAQPLVPAAAAGGTISVCGFAAGGACAAAVPQATIHKLDAARAVFIIMDGKRPKRTDVPRRTAEPSGFMIADQREMPHRRHWSTLH
jgi:hypothetical protein